MWRDSRDRNGGISPPPTRLRDFPNAHNCSRVKMEFDSNSSDIRLSTLNPIFSLPHCSCCLLTECSIKVC